MSRREFLKAKKPGAAAKHIPAGHTAMKTCPTCHGTGKIKADALTPGDKPDSLKQRMLRRV